MWDVEGTTKSGSELAPILILEEENIIEDVNWHRQFDNILGSVSDDKNIRIWDTRNKDKPTHKFQGHKSEVNSIDFSPFSEYLFLTTGSDSKVKLWDMRSLKSDLHTFESHQDEVFNVSWSPFNETVFATTGSDRKVMVWDLTCIGMEQNQEDAEDGPPELLFIHGGHTSKISDFCWNQNKGEEWMIVSTAEDNIIQVWQMAENIYEKNDEKPIDEGIL